ncbi:MAG: restriction endonuclease subunit S [Flavobacteriales bacterium]|nr:restriction endonuclease subunit S [Flavobacteriales bacterium]
MIYNESKFNTEWDTLPLSKLGEFKRGKSKHRPRNDQKLFEGGKYPLIQTGEIKAANLLIKKHNAAYNEEGLKQSKMWPAGTLAITIAANIAETGILSYPMCFPDSCVGFIANKEKTSELFMHYVFTYIKRSIQNSAVGSIQDNINIEMLTALNFKIPKKPIQDLIVDLLSAIDYKIELNNDINTELENLAKTIFNYWFVQFDFPNEEGKPYKTSGGEMEWNDELKKEIPKGWKAVLLKDKLEFDRGVEPGSNKYFETPNEEVLIPFYKVGSMDGNADVWIEKEVANGAICKEDDILLSLDGSVGRIAIGLNGAYSSGIRKVYQKEGYFPKSYIYFLLHSQEIQQTIKKNATGSNILHAAKALDYMIAPYNENIVRKYNGVSKPIFEKILLIKRENQELIKLRDFLLPLLMNGQVKVKSEAIEQLSMAAEQQVKYGK